MIQYVQKDLKVNSCALTEGPKTVYSDEKLVRCDIPHPHFKQKTQR